MNNYSAAGLVTRTFDTLGIDAFPGPPPRSTARRTNLVRISRHIFGAKRSREGGPGGGAPSPRETWNPFKFHITLIKACSMLIFHDNPF